MKKKQIIISIVVLFGLTTALMVYNYVFHNEHRNIAEEKASLALTANVLHNDFLKDEATATSKYLDKVIEATGKITTIENNSITLNEKLQVSFNNKALPKFKDGQALTIKGRCVGYDELLEVVKIDQATIITK